MSEAGIEVVYSCDKSDACLAECRPDDRMKEIAVRVLSSIQEGEVDVDFDITDITGVDAHGVCATGPVIDEASGDIRCNPEAEVIVETDDFVATFGAK